MRTVDTVLFDLDDTLHDDSRAYRAAARMAAQDVARTYGVAVDRSGSTIRVRRCGTTRCARRGSTIGR
jgi:phosphoglycolate phosphatase-like HAD superfamily hydrolase